MTRDRRISRQASTPSEPLPTPSPSPLMTLPEVADYLRVSEATLRAWRKKGVGPEGRRVIGGVRYRRSDVEAWFAGLSSQEPTS